MEAQNALMICYDALVINETNVFLCVIIYVFQAYLCIFISFRLWCWAPPHQPAPNQGSAVSLVALR